MIIEENSCAYCMDLWDISYNQIAGSEEAFGVDLSLGQALRPPLKLASTHLRRVFMSQSQAQYFKPMLCFQNHEHGHEYKDNSLKFKQCK